MTTSIACPYCHTDSRILPVYSGGAQTNLGYSLYHCEGCDLPFITVLEMVPKVTVHRIEGFEPQIKPEYEADIPIAPELATLDTHETYAPTGTHPDPSQFLCDSCGTLNDIREKHVQPNGEKWCVSCIGKSMEDKHDEIPSKELQFTQIHGNVWAAISGESAHLKYGNSKCGIWDRTIFDTLLEMDEDERRKEIDELVKGMANKQQRKACLRQFTIALEKGEVSFPEVA